MTADIQPPPRYFFYDANLNQVGTQVHYEDAFKKAFKALTLE